MTTTVVREKYGLNALKKPTVTGIPRHIHKDTYESAIQRVTNQLSTYDGVTSVYQIGNISTPGISDIDMLVVFEKGYSIDENPLKALTEDERYLFVHGLYGVPSSLFEQLKQFFFLNNYRLLLGSEVLRSSDLAVYSNMPRDVRCQIAFEYLIKMYITLCIQRVYRVFKLRDFFLHAKALVYDLELLNVHDGPLYDAVQTVVDMRNAWFTQRTSEHQILTALAALELALHAFLGTEVHNHDFYLPGPDSYQISRSISIKKGDSFKPRQTGVVLPSVLNRIGRRYYSLQNRLLKFEFDVPAVTENLPRLVKERFQATRNAKIYNIKHLPHFLPLTSSLNIG